MDNAEITKTKKFSKANYPFLIAIGLLFVAIIPAFLAGVLPDSLMILMLIIGLISIISFSVLCIVGLALQILNKDKTILDKILLGLNFITCIGLVLLMFFVFVAFPNDFKGEKDVRKQISQEYSTLEKEYKPVLDYLAQYKKSNGVYPETIDNKIIPKSEVFEFYKYSKNNNGSGYWLQVYPKNGPIEYYYNDENDNGYNYYNGNGFIDGFLDNDFYYEIDNKWHAVMLQHFTRHSKFWNGGSTEREADEWMKNNSEKFEESSEKNK